MRTKNPLTLCCLLSLFVGGTCVNAAPLEEARVSRVIQDVRLMAGNAAPRPAAVNDDVKQGMAVRTGSESRAELTFTDLTITRLGQNTVFSIKGGTREVALDSGAILLQVPHGGEPANVRTAAVSASISGGTMMVSSNRNFPTKVLVPEGVSHFCSLIHPTECVDVHGGEMAMMLADGTLTKPEKFNGRLVYSSAHLLTDFPPLPNEYLFVFNEVEETDGEPPPNEGDEIDKTDQRAAASPSPSETETPPPSSPTPTPSTPTPTPGGTPGKFGPPATIKSPNPYVIDSTTVINTDPSITTNGGAPDFGKIYRGRDIDGPFSLWAFGSTSAFDTSSDFDNHIDGSGAAFKFSSLVVAGTPTINTAGGETSLGLIGVNSISIDIVGTLDFTGLHGLLFATVNGPVFIGNKTFIEGGHDLGLYARGANSDLTSNGALSAERHVRLWAERDIFAAFATSEKFRADAGRDIFLNQSNVSGIDAVTIRAFAGRDLNLGGLSTDKTVFDSEGDVELLANRNIVSSDSIVIFRTSPDLGAGIDGNDEGSPSLNVIINAEEGDITIAPTADKLNPSSLIVNINNSFFDLDNGANITLNAGGNFLAKGDVDLDLNNNSGHIGDGGNISATTGGSFTAATLSARINNLNGGSIDSGGNIDFNIGGALTITGGASFRITSSDPPPPGHESDNVETINVNASSIDVAGNLTANISHNGLNFSSQGNVSVHADGNLMVTGDLDSWGRVSAGTDGTVGNITVGGVVSVPTELAANGSISVTGGIFAFAVSAGTDITVGPVGGQGTNVPGGNPVYYVNDTTAGNALNLINVSIVSPVSTFSSGDIGFSPSDMTITVDSIVTTGPAIPSLISNGEDADPNFGNDNPGNGGKVTLNINDAGLTIGSTGQFNHMEANGGNYAADSTAGGNGGMVNINAAGDVVLNNGANGAPAITTLTGLIPGGGSNTLGEGGTVNITTTGEVIVNSTVQVSSNEFVGTTPSGTPAPLRRSASGGDITIASSKTSGSAINVTSSAQLLSLLSAAATGPGGKITLIASDPQNNGDNNSSIDIDNANGDPGAITAEHGTVEIRHEGGNGVINISNANIFADVVKIGALGTAGTLSIGGGTISANMMLKLYAPGSNGLIKFTANVLLDRDSTKILAANTITILDGVTVTIGGTTPANVYVTFVEGTPNANYAASSGGNGNTTGTFAGAGANAPQPLASAPPFDDTGTSGSRHNTASATQSGPVYLQVAVPVRQNGTLSVSHIRSPGPTNLPPIRQ